MTSRVSGRAARGACGIGGSRWPVPAAQTSRRLTGRELGVRGVFLNRQAAGTFGGGCGRSAVAKDGGFDSSTIAAAFSLLFCGHSVALESYCYQILG